MKTEVQPLAHKTSAAARILSVSTRTLYDLTAPRGPIRAVRIKKGLLYPHSELERFLAEGLAACVSEEGQK
ncbi:helix-turn-helix domain-containing protein [Rhodopirellula sp. MGV]|uniref:helix-turn-helix domain-containing protein n=1 Tax=Rhodopirellula sp. MGV TaxID=2023130 RepID=UPI0013045B97|nr:helix-turn-helix domain-containing protein [Rhodopirellula sp. MGV]